MIDKKRRLFRLIESHINDYNIHVIETCYGKGTQIKIHSMNELVTKKILIFEVIVVLGEIITEEIMDKEPAHVLIKDALMWFFPDYTINTVVRWDV